MGCTQHRHIDPSGRGAKTRAQVRFSSINPNPPLIGAGQVKSLFKPDPLPSLEAGIINLRPD